MLLEIISPFLISWEFLNENTALSHKGITVPKCMQNLFGFVIKFWIVTIITFNFQNELEKQETSKQVCVPRQSFNSWVPDRTYAKQLMLL
jgi:hypothetical protein